MTFSGASEQQVREVCARDQQHKTDCRKQDVQRASRFTDDALVQRKQYRGPVLGISGILCGKVFIDDVHLRARLLESDARRQPSVRFQEMNAAKICGERIRNVYRRPRLRLDSWCDKRLWHHADNGVHVAAECNGFAENLLVVAELLDPQFMTQHDDVGTTVPIVVAGGDASALGLDSEGFKEAASHLSNLKLNGLRTGRGGQTLHDHAAKPAERLALRLNISEIGPRLIGSETD